MQEGPSSVEPRVSRLEAQLTDLASTVESLSSTVQRMGESLAAAMKSSESALRDDIRELARGAVASRTTNWSVLLAAGGLSIILATTFVKGYIDPVSANQAAISGQAAENAADLRDIWHNVVPETIERDARLDERIKALEAKR